MTNSKSSTEDRTSSLARWLAQHFGMSFRDAEVIVQLSQASATPQDTGSCDVTGLLEAAVAGFVSVPRLRRIGPMVTLTCGLQDPGTEPFRVPLLTLPLGFRPLAPVTAITPLDAADRPERRATRIGVSGVVSYGGPTSPEGFELYIAWVTAQEWPEDLPGPVVRDDLQRPGAVASSSSTVPKKSTAGAPAPAGR